MGRDITHISDWGNWFGFSLDPVYAYEFHWFESTKVRWVNRLFCEKYSEVDKLLRIAASDHYLDAAYLGLLQQAQKIVTMTLLMCTFLLFQKTVPNWR